jgi:hypothetical protein
MLILSDICCYQAPAQALVQKHYLQTLLSLVWYKTKTVGFQLSKIPRLLMNQIFQTNNDEKEDYELGTNKVTQTCPRPLNLT